MTKEQLEMAKKLQRKKDFAVQIQSFLQDKILAFADANSQLATEFNICKVFYDSITKVGMDLQVQCEIEFSNL